MPNLDEARQALDDYLEYVATGEVWNEGSLDAIGFIGARSVAELHRRRDMLAEVMLASCEDDHDLSLIAAIIIGEGALEDPAGLSLSNQNHVVLRSQYDALVRARERLNLVFSSESSLKRPEPRSGPSEQLLKLGEHDKTAWQLSILYGKTQAAIAEMLNEQFNTTYTQGTVSKMIARAKAHAEASGLNSFISEDSRPKFYAVDPQKLDAGPTTEKRTPRQKRK